MTEKQGRQLMIMAAQADYLGALRERNRISEDEYFGRLNGLREQAGLEPIQRKPDAAPRLIASGAWGS